MGTDYAPLLANLFLFYEYKFMKEKLKEDSQVAKIFSNTSILWWLTLNNPTFKQEISNIYPQQLELKRTTETDSRLSYLDLEVNISDRFTTAVFDKPDGLFSISLTWIATYLAMGFYISQLVRIGCMWVTSLFTRHHQLTFRLVKRLFVRQTSYQL